MAKEKKHAKHTEIGDRLKELRETLNMTQLDFGERFGVKQSAVSLWETARDPSPSLQRLICYTFDVNPDWLGTGRGKIFQKPQVEESEMTMFRLAELVAELFEPFTPEKVRLLHIIASKLKASAGTAGKNDVQKD